MTDERVARELLGRWLAAEPGRTWSSTTDSGAVIVWLWNIYHRGAFDGHVKGSGTTLAAAIDAALGGTK